MRKQATYFLFSLYQSKINQKSTTRLVGESSFTTEDFYKFCFNFYAFDDSVKSPNYPTQLAPFLLLSSLNLFFRWCGYLFPTERFEPVSCVILRRKVVVYTLPFFYFWQMLDTILNSYFFNCYLQQVFVYSTRNVCLNPPLKSKKTLAHLKTKNYVFNLTDKNVQNMEFGLNKYEILVPLYQNYLTMFFR